ncbi:MAG: pta [Pedosphaera sp.]|nr:pta [Pedosphaera sp.]
MAKMRSGLKALNMVHQVPEALDRGYHETLTMAWMHLVHCTLCEFGPGETADVFMDKQAQLLSKRALLLFYSRDRIMSLEAKHGFVEPDLTPLPQSRKSVKLPSQVTE